MKIRDIITKCSTSGVRWVWILMLIASAMSMADFVSANIFKHSMQPWLRFTCLMTSAAFKATILTLFYILCRKNRWLKAVALTILSIYSILSLANFICFEFYGFGVSHKMLTLISETNPSEAKDFLQTLIQNSAETITFLNVVRIAFIIAIIYRLIKLSEKNIHDAGTRILGNRVCHLYIFGSKRLIRKEQSVDAGSDF